MIYLFRILYIVLLLFSSACVSVSLGTSQSKKATEVKYEQPSSVFSELKSETADKAWQSKATGNTLAYLSECNSNIESNLKSIEQDFLNALNNLSIVSTSHAQFNGRESLRTTAQGTVDGVAVQVSLLVFKKNNCNFTLSYTGKKINFDKELNEFEAFINNFRVN